MPLRSFLAKALRVSHWAKNRGKRPSPLLDLPMELRLFIYSYLIPNITVEIAAQRLRSDSSPVCPALLRLNRQIYTEVREQWYGSNIYKARMTGIWLEIYGKRLYCAYLLPSTPQQLQTFYFVKTLKYIRVLDLSIVLRKPPQNKEISKQLAKCFPPEEPHALEKLFLAVEVSMGVFRVREIGDGKLLESGMRRDIELVLKPLRSILGLKLVRVRRVGAAEGKYPGDAVLDLVRRVFPVIVAEIFQMD